MVRVFSFDFKKAFDSVPHDVLCDKIKNLPINTYVINWMMNLNLDVKVTNDNDTSVIEIENIIDWIYNRENNGLVEIVWN